MLQKLIVLGLPENVATQLACLLSLPRKGRSLLVSDTLAVQSLVKSALTTLGVSLEVFSAEKPELLNAGADILLMTSTQILSGVSIKGFGSGAYFEDGFNRQRNALVRERIRAALAAKAPTIAELEAENEELRSAIKSLIPCAEAAEVCLRANGLTAAANKCDKALGKARSLVGIPSPDDQRYWVPLD